MRLEDMSPEFRKRVEAMIAEELSRELDELEAFEEDDGDALDIDPYGMGQLVKEDPMLARVSRRLAEGGAE